MITDLISSAHKLFTCGYVAEREDPGWLKIHSIFFRIATGRGTGKLIARL